VKTIRSAILTALLLAAASCSARRPDVEAPKTLEVRSPDFSDMIPASAAVAPPKLMWSGTPAGTRELALIVDDPDAPTSEPYVHYVLTRIAPKGPPPPSLVGRNESGGTAWEPLDPPSGETHRYYFRLYALDIALGDQPKSKAELLKDMKGHVLAWGELVGRYAKK
jgi:Raf kinase inhibitor-like YbhB/YbcL family protein